MSHIITAIVVIKTLTLALGGLITLLSYRAYARTGARALRALAIGFGVVTVGAIAAGLLHQLTPLGLRGSVLVESLLTLVGFAIITYSLYVD
ncbi:MAG: hypothetical protein ABEJ81_00530 [Haloferacaceae archaeon]